MKKKTLFIAASLVALMSSPLVFAKTVNLYDQPKANSKIVGTLDSNDGMILVFTPKGSDWIEVANPKNGIVGWILSKDSIGDASHSGTSVSISSQTLDTGNGPQSYQIVKFGTPRVMTTAEQDAMMAKIHKQQLEVQQSVQKMMQQFYQEMNAYYDQNPAVMMNSSDAYPIILPVVVFPVSAPATAIPQKTSVDQSAVIKGPVLNTDKKQ